MTRKVATIISRIFDPFITLGVLFVLAFYTTPIFIPAFLLMIVLPFFLFLIALKTNVVSNWDVSDRSERPKILWSLVIIEIVSSLLLRTTIAIPILAVLFGFAVITQFWKMSGHVVSAALTTGFIIARFGIVWWPVLLVVPVIGWARIVTKNHTTAQVIAGAIYSFILVFLFYEIR